MNVDNGGLHLACLTQLLQNLLNVGLERGRLLTVLFALLGAGLLRADREDEVLAVDAAIALDRVRAQVQGRANDRPHGGGGDGGEGHHRQPGQQLTQLAQPAVAGTEAALHVLDDAVGLVDGDEQQLALAVHQCQRVKPWCMRAMAASACTVITKEEPLRHQHDAVFARTHRRGDALVFLSHAEEGDDVGAPLLNPKVGKTRGLGGIRAEHLVQAARLVLHKGDVGHHHHRRLVDGRLHGWRRWHALRRRVWRRCEPGAKRDDCRGGGGGSGCGGGGGGR